MDFHGYPWVSMDIHGYPWKPMGTLGIPTGSHGFPWVPVGSHRFPWVPGGMGGGPTGITSPMIIEGFRVKIENRIFPDSLISSALGGIEEIVLVLYLR